MLVTAILFLVLPPATSPAAGPIQLCIAVDGSASLEREDFAALKSALAAAIEDSSVLPHNGLVELTVLQFGTFFSETPVLVEPTIIDSAAMAAAAASAVRGVEIDPTTNLIVWQWISSGSSLAGAAPGLPLMNARTFVPLAASSYSGGW